jgi:transposase
MEACFGAHHLSRKLNRFGHDARLMPAKYVRPYSKGQKNDFRDAEAIAEAVHVVHNWIIVLSYIIGATFPGLGLMIRRIELGSINVARTQINFLLPLVMLAFLLFNAGLGIRTTELTSLMRNPSPLVAGAAANLSR